MCGNGDEGMRLDCGMFCCKKMLSTFQKVIEVEWREEKRSEAMVMLMEL